MNKPTTPEPAELIPTFERLRSLVQIIAKSHAIAGNDKSEAMRSVRWVVGKADIHHNMSHPALTIGDVDAIIDETYQAYYYQD